MTIQKRHKRRKRKRNSLVNFILVLTLCAIILFTYKQMRGYADGIRKTGQTDIANGASNASEGYSLITMESEALSQGKLVLVNKDHPYGFPEEQTFVSIYDEKIDCYFVRDMEVLIDASIMDDLNGLMEAFNEEMNIHNVNIVAGHRTKELQQTLYDESLEAKGEEYTAMFLALPGCSEHHTGLAVDFSIYHSDTGDSEEFDGSGHYSWFSENSWRYGFILRYEDAKSSITGVGNEPWHFRYVGVPHAYYMTTNDLSLEEYNDLLHGYPYDEEHLKIEVSGQNYEVYFCSGVEVYVPEKDDYTVSGNNVDGFIVTVKIA